jgi:hypothetical protein
MNSRLGITMDWIEALSDDELTARIRRCDDAATRLLDAGKNGFARAYMRDALVYANALIERRQRESGE